MNDSRPAVRDKAVETIIGRGEAILNLMSKLILESSDSIFIKRCLWAVSRIKSKSSLTILQRALKDSNSGVRQVAARSLGRLRDKTSLAPLTELLSDTSQSVRASAATAIGQLDDKKALSYLFRNLDSNDPIHTKHSFVYAISQIGNSAEVSSYLSDNRYPYRQRIALKVLASLGSELDSKQVVPLLQSADSNVREEARRLIAGRREMRKEIIKIFSNIVKEEEQELSNEELIEGIIIAYAQDSDFQDILLNILNDKEIKTEIKIQVLSSLSFLDRFPDPLQIAILIG